MGLLLSALRLAWPAPPHQATRMPSWYLAVPLGAAIGLLAGLTGTGGGIFLSPLLVLCRWGETRTSGGVAAAFILCNSLAGLAGHRPDLSALPPALPWWLVVVALAGLLGSWIGSRRATPMLFRRLLAVVLLVAAGKLIVA
jgi:uncharacterized membrane protein YfcA